MRYFYDGVNEIVDYDGSGNRSRFYVHGISYFDERLMMHDETNDRPYCYTIDRMYNVTKHCRPCRGSGRAIRLRSLSVRGESVWKPRFR